MIKLLFAFIFISLSAPAFSASNDILGEWLSEGGKSKIDIYRCSSKYCGKIIWLKEPNYSANDNQGKAGEKKLDKNNPVKSLRNNPIINLNILTGFNYSGGNEWEDGEIYDPENGKTYSSILTLENRKTLNVRGYIGFSLFGRSTTWTRE